MLSEIANIGKAEIVPDLKQTGVRDDRTPIVVNNPGPYNAVIQAIERDDGKVVAGGIEVRKSRPTILPADVFINVNSVLPSTDRAFDSVEEMRRSIQ